MLGDTLGSIGALVAGIVIIAMGWTPIDLIASLAIAVLIVISGAKLTREATDILLEVAPPGLEPDRVAEAICAVPGVLGVHDLHLWTVTSGFPALSCHIEVDGDQDMGRVLLVTAQRIQERFGLLHITLQPETAALHAEIGCCTFPDQLAPPAFSVGHREPGTTAEG